MGSNGKKIDFKPIPKFEKFERVRAITFCIVFLEFNVEHNEVLLKVG